jgi:NADPH:quinone reductase-like Zn-dependent oxidoreductase
MIKVTRSAVIDAPIERVWAVLRDFNSHTAWHAIVAESAIEGGEPSDQVGCVRNFTLKDGNHIREQLLALSDEDHVSTYCILDATLPMQRYVATVQLKRVTDGNRTFWHWESTFDVPRGREREFADLVGKGVYEAGFEGLRNYLRQSRAAPAAAPALRRAARGAIRGNAIVLDRHGGADELKLREIDVLPPGPGEARLRQTAIGLNYIDVYVRTGHYPMLSLPGVPGMEAAGEVIDVGEGVTGILPGDRVAYACPPPGAYAQYRTLKAEQLVVLPEAIGDEAAAALMLKGMSAEYLLRRVYRVQRGDFVLVHSAAGGVGLLLCQWAKHLGATVIGTVSTEAKARAARAAGCDHPIVATQDDFVARTREITGGRGAIVAYDAVGKDTLAGSLEALAPTGHLVSYGQSSGAPEPPPLGALSAKSITFSRPVLFHYTADPAVLREMAGNVFDLVARRALRVEIGQRFPLAEAARAHRELEARRTIGATVLAP